MQVAEVMTRDVKTCGNNDLATSAARVMWEHDCGSVPVLNGEGKVVGIVTDRDLCMAAYTQGVALSLIRVESAMARTVMSCVPEDEIATAEELMRQNQVHRLPVISPEGKLAGIVSLSDIARHSRMQTAKPGIASEEVVDTLDAIARPRPHVGSSVVYGPEEGEMEFRPGPPKKRGQWRK